MKQKRTLLESFNHAIRGLVYVLNYERNVKFHVVIALLVLIASLFFRLTKVESLILILTIAFVLITEVVNTAVEVVVDLITESYHPLAKMAKDIAAGAVLLSALNSVLVAYILFVSKSFKTDIVVESVIEKILNKPEYVIVISLTIVLIIVVTAKIMTHKGSPLKGGMPSGHSAFSFAIVTFTFFLYHNIMLSFLVFVLACMVAVSRVKEGIHSALEVVLGSILGFIISFICILLLRSCVIAYF